jgi:hypothetical protein
MDTQVSAREPDRGAVFADCSPELFIGRHTMNEDLREAIKLCKECPTPLTPQWKLILTTAEQVLEAASELPEKKEVDTYVEFGCERDRPLDEYAGEKGFNEALSLCQPILAKKNLRIAELSALVDGASVVVELFNATTPAQIEWRKRWLDKFKEDK